MKGAWGYQEVHEVWVGCMGRQHRFRKVPGDAWECISGVMLVKEGIQGAVWIGKSVWST